MPKIFPVYVKRTASGGAVTVPTEINLVDVEIDVAHTELETGIVMPDNQEDIAHTALEADIILPNNQTENALSELELETALPNNQTAPALTALESNINLPNAQEDIAHTALESNINMPNSQVLTSFKVLGAPFWQAREFATANNLVAAGGVLSITVNRPTGTEDGDLLLASIGGSAAATMPTITPPAGWTLIRSTTLTIAGGAASQMIVNSYRKFASSEPASYNFTLTNNGAGGEALVLNGEIHRINGIDGTTPIDIDTGATLLATALDPDPDAPSVTTTVVNTLVFSFLFHSHLAVVNQTHTQPAGFAERTDFNGGAAATVNIFGSCSATRGFAAIGATGTMEFNCTETVATDAIMQRIAIAPGELQL